MTREETFEKMLSDIEQQYSDIMAKMERLKNEGKAKTVTYRELMGDKMLYARMLDVYRSYGLTK